MIPPHDPAEHVVRPLQRRGVDPYTPAVTEALASM
jgi:hypothetical protein